MDKKKIINWVIAIIVAIVYLAVSIIFNAWAYSWLIWVALQFILSNKSNCSNIKSFDVAIIKPPLQLTI